MTITKKGLEIAMSLYRLGVVGTDEVAETCSRIGRLATTHSALQERACNVAMTDAEAKRHQQRDEQIEEKIKQHVAALPKTKHGPIAVQFDSDPRGLTVRLLVPMGKGRVDEVGCQ